MSEITDYIKLLEAINNNTASEDDRQKIINGINEMDALAREYEMQDNYQKALEFKEKVYAFRCSVFGENHPDTMKYLCDIAFTYGVYGDHHKALEIQKRRLVFIAMFWKKIIRIH